MQLYYTSIGLAILSNVFYHIFQKSISSQMNPIVSLIITYASAIIFSLCLLPLFPGRLSLAEYYKLSIWPSVALGVAIVGLEMGFLLAYRAGWNLSVAAVFSNVAVALFLVPLGLLIFKENVSFLNFLGVIFCIGGIVMVER